MPYRAILIAYGVVNVVGGVIGLVVGKSATSLAVGGTAGVVLVGLGVLARSNPGVAFRTAALLTLGLLGFWIHRYGVGVADGKTMVPSANIALALAVMAALAFGHFSKTRRGRSTEQAG